MTPAAAELEQLHELWGPGFASPELVDAAVGLFPRALPGLSRVRGPVLREGPMWYVEVAAGAVAVRWKHPVKEHHSWEEDLQRSASLARIEALGDELLPAKHDGPPSRRILSWSPRSRARMVQRLAELDLRPLFAERGVPAMVTLTLPGDWLAVAPTAKAAHKLLKKWRKRYQRAWGRELHAVWKREFQERGAPHWHLLMVPPAGTVAGLSFFEWLSWSWAEVVGSERCDRQHVTGGDCCEYGRHLAAGTGVDFREGARATDPKRLGIYFAKHGAYSAKEYQNSAPAEWAHDASCRAESCDGCAAEGVGRYWGVWALKRHVGSVEVSATVALAVLRTMRRHARANRYLATEKRWRREVVQDYHLGEQTKRWKQRNVKVWKQQLTGGRTSGFLLVNDGPAYASQLGRVADLAHEQAQRW